MSHFVITDAIVTKRLLTGYSVGANAVLASSDSLLTAFGKIQAQINAFTSASLSWGTITGTLSAQTDLQNALNAKVATTRTLTINGTTLDLSANRSWSVGDVLKTGTPVTNQLAFWGSSTNVQGSNAFTVSNTLNCSITIGGTGNDEGSLNVKDLAGTFGSISGRTGLSIWGSTTYKRVNIFSSSLEDSLPLLSLHNNLGTKTATFDAYLTTSTTQTGGTNLGAYNIDRTFIETISGPNQHGFVDKTIYRYGGTSNFSAFYAENTMGATNATYAQDFWAGFKAKITKDGANTVTHLYDFLALAPTVSAGTVTNRYGLYVSDKTGAGTLTNQYGLYVPTFIGGTNNWTIYSIDAPSYHGGEFRIGASTDAGTYKLQVTGNTWLDGSVIINDSGANVGFRIESDTLTSAFEIEGATGHIIMQSLDTDSAAPTATGITKMVITDSLGKLSFLDIPTGAGTLYTGYTTDATVTTLTTIAGLPVYGTGLLTVQLTATLTNDTVAGYTGEKKVRFLKDNTTITMGTLVDTMADEIDLGLSGATWTVDQNAGTIRIRVTGIAATSIKWKVQYSYLLVEPEP